MKLIIFILTIIVTGFNTSIAQVDIIMKDGESIRAIIIEQSEYKVKIKKLKDNSVVSIDKLFIDEIKPLVTTITTIKDEIYEGSIIKFDSLKIVLNTDDGKEFELDRKQVRHIEINDYYSVMNYPMLGISGGLPAMLNIIGGYHFRYIGFRLESGLSFSNNYYAGIKFNILLNIVAKESIECNIALSGGYIHIPSETTSYNYEQNWIFGGISGDINLSGFFLEIGIARDFNEHGEYFPLIQLGYVYRFVD